MGWFDERKNEIPRTSTIVAILLLIINIVFPGIGTIIMSFMNKCKWMTALVGLLQLLTAFILVGWIWSIYWGILCLQRAY